MLKINVIWPRDRDPGNALYSPQSDMINVRRGPIADAGDRGASLAPLFRARARGMRTL